MSNDRIISETKSALDHIAEENLLVQQDRMKVRFIKKDDLYNNAHN